MTKVVKVKVEKFTDQGQGVGARTCSLYDSRKLSIERNRC